jgi:hypothetical protein
MQRIIGIVLGAVVTYLLLLLFQGGRIISDQNTGFLVAVVAGAIMSWLWPIVIGWWLVKRHRERQEERVQEEVARQIAEQQKTTPPR